MLVGALQPLVGGVGVCVEKCLPPPSSRESLEKGKMQIYISIFCPSLWRGLGCTGTCVGVPCPEQEGKKVSPS